MRERERDKQHACLAVVKLDFINKIPIISLILKKVNASRSVSLPFRNKLETVYPQKLAIVVCRNLFNRKRRSILDANFF